MKIHKVFRGPTLSLNLIEIFHNFLILVKRKLTWPDDEFTLFETTSMFDSITIFILAILFPLF